MTSTEPEQGAPPSSAPEARASEGLPPWLRGAAAWVGIGLGVVLLVVLGVALLPGWWASLVSGWVVGVDGRGIPIGLLVGALFTVLPLGAVLIALRSGLSPRTRVVLVAAGLLLLLPNVLTLAVSLSGSDARSVLVIGAPGFRGASAVGVGLVLALLATVILVRRRSARTRGKVSAAGEQATRLARERPAGAAPGTGTASVDTEPATTGPAASSGDGSAATTTPGEPPAEASTPTATSTAPASSAVEPPGRPTPEVTPPGHGPA